MLIPIGMLTSKTGNIDSLCCASTDILITAENIERTKHARRCNLPRMEFSQQRKLQMQ